LAADIDATKRSAALAAGAAEVFDPADPEARKAVLKATRGVLAAVDFVGSESSLKLATGVLGTGGKAVVVGLIGGTLTMPIAMFPIKGIAIEGTLTGTLAEAHEMLAIAKAGRVPSIPITERPLEAAQQSLDDLRHGRIVGRVILTP
jgi:alcohol dehydrogenase